MGESIYFLKQKGVETHYNQKLSNYWAEALLCVTSQLRWTGPELNLKIFEWLLKNANGYPKKAAVGAFVYACFPSWKFFSHMDSNSRGNKSVLSLGLSVLRFQVASLKPTGVFGWLKAVLRVWSVPALCSVWYQQLQMAI